MASNAPPLSFSGSLSARGRRRLLAGLPAALALLLAMAGCGGGAKQQGTGERASTTPRATAPRSRSTGTAGAGATTQPRTGGGPKSPEQQPGGAGDEEPARVPASFSGRGGRISPRTVHVPPYIAVQVQLRSGDGRDYGLRFPGALVRVGPGKRVDSALLEGLRPGRSVSGTPMGGGSPVRIVANAEPGP